MRAAAFNLLMARLTGIDIKNSSDFELLDRVAVDAIIDSLPERRRFYRGLAGWIGYSTATLPFDVCRRESGQAKMSLRRLLGLATVAIVTFTAAPLRIVSLLGPDFGLWRHSRRADPPVMMAGRGRVRLRHDHFYNADTE
jgi:hypothetical protein